MAENAMQDALNALATLEESVKNTSGKTDNVLAAVEGLKNDLKKLKTEDHSYIDSANGVVQVAQGVVDNIDKFTSGDALEIASGAIGLIGTIGAVVGGPFGPLIAGVCGLVASILPLFGGNNGPSMDQVMDKIIRDALEDFKDEAIADTVRSSLKEMSAKLAFLTGLGEKDCGIINENEKSFLEPMSLMTTGCEILGILQNEIDKYKNSHDSKKCNRLAMYCYYYAMISLQKSIILTLQCSLLRRNDLEHANAGVEKYLYDVLPKEDRTVLDFISELPEDSNSWWLLYRHLHTDLSTQQRMVLSEYRNLIKCEPMTGQLCNILNTYQNEYLYLPENGFAYDSDRRRVFTYRSKNVVDAQGLFRIVGSYTNCCIFSVYFGEYLYAADYPPCDGDRRHVFSWRSGGPVNQGDWQIYNGESDCCQIRNLKQNEYIYAADYAPYDDSRRNVFTWTPGDEVVQGDWRIEPLSFETSDLKL